MPLVSLACPRFPSLSLSSSTSLLPAASPFALLLPPSLSRLPASFVPLVSCLASLSLPLSASLFQPPSRGLSLRPPSPALPLPPPFLLRALSPLGLSFPPSLSASLSQPPTRGLSLRPPSVTLSHLPPSFDRPSNPTVGPLHCLRSDSRGTLPPSVASCYARVERSPTWAVWMTRWLD